FNGAALRRARRPLQPRSSAPCWPTLQRSRAPKSAETPGPPSLPSPRRSPSTEPRSEERGDGQPSNHTIHTQTAFNGAALRRARRRESTNGALRWKNDLQRSRAPKSAETRDSRQLPRGADLPSTEPRSEERGDSVPLPFLPMC